MDDLAPPLIVCMNLRLHLENGAAVIVGMKKVLRSYRIELGPEFTSDLLSVLAHFEKGLTVNLSTLRSTSLYRRALLELVASGLKGVPIANSLRELEIEVTRACENELEAFISALPMKTMLSLMLIQFPAFLILVFGPILTEMLRGFGL